MFTKEYPYLLAGLPELIFNGDVKAFSFAKLTDEIKENISDNDKKLLRLLLMGLKENSQTAAFYSETAKSKNKFIQDYFSFDCDLRNLLAGAAARQLNLKADAFLIGQNIITDAILHSKANDFGLSSEIDFMPTLHAIIETPNLLEREQKLDLLRWAKADELTVFNYLDINRILAFVIKANIVRRWLELDKEKGQEFFARLVQEIKNSRKENNKEENAE